MAVQKRPPAQPLRGAGRRRRVDDLLNFSPRPAVFVATDRAIRRLARETSADDQFPHFLII